MEKIRWGILSTGSIARSFARDLSLIPDAEITAVGSRTQSSADEFANEYNIPNRHASYEALAADPQVDVIYVATPHTLHAENSVACMHAGKAVLCEKAFAMTAAEAEQHGLVHSITDDVQMAAHIDPQYKYKHIPDAMQNRGDVVQIQTTGNSTARSAIDYMTLNARIHKN